MEENVTRPTLKDDVELELFFPVKIGNSENAEIVSKLKFRRPKGKDMRDVPAKPTIGDLMKLAARLCGQPPFVIDNLEIPDFNRVNEVVGDFLDDGRKTGETA